MLFLAWLQSLLRLGPSAGKDARRQPRVPAGPLVSLLTRPSQPVRAAGARHPRRRAVRNSRSDLLWVGVGARIPIDNIGIRAPANPARVVPRGTNPRGASPVRGRLCKFAQNWHAVTDDQWVLKTVQDGYLVEFTDTCSVSSNPK